MKRRNTILASLALSASVVVVAPPALSAEHFVVVERPTNESIIETGGQEDAVGNLFVFANPVFDAANQAQVGTDNGYCVRTVAGKLWECVWTMVFKEGRLTAQGMVEDDRESLFTVTGGTGKYLGATGQMTLRPRPGTPKAWDFIFNLE